MTSLSLWDKPGILCRRHVNICQPSHGTGMAAQVTASSYAFAAVRQDGTVVTWGDAACGGDSSCLSSRNVWVPVISVLCLSSITHVVGTELETSKDPRHPQLYIFLLFLTFLSCHHVSTLKCYSLFLLGMPSWRCNNDAWIRAACMNQIGLNIIQPMKSHDSHALPCYVMLILHVYL